MRTRVKTTVASALTPHENGDLSEHRDECVMIQRVSVMRHALNQAVLHESS